MRTRSIGVALFVLIAIGLPTLAFAAGGQGTATEGKRMPKVNNPRPSVFRCDTAPTLLFGRSIKADSSALLALQERIRTRFGTAPVSTTPTAKLSDSPYLLLGLAQDHPALKQLIADHKTELPKEGLGPEGYILDITPERVLVAASEPAGVFYGARQLLEMDTADKGLELPAAAIADWPTMAWRGIHLLVNSRADIPHLEKLLTEKLPAYRLNRLIMEINYHFQFKSHPEVTEGDPLTREDCRRLKEVADKNFVQLIPMINCLGHQSWAEHTAKLLKSHPEFDETPEHPADNKGIYCRSWCPSHPEVNKVVCALIDELVEAFDAKAFHVGMDEVFLLGKCARCKGQGNAKLFAKSVNDLHAHLVGKRKLEMLMWGDRLLNGKSTGYGEWEASANATEAAIDLIPKDIILCDWHYETKYGGVPATYPSVSYFQEKGFRVLPSSWRSEENARMLAACSLENKTPRMMGYLATTWTNAGSLVTEPTAEQGERRRNIVGVLAAIRTGSQIAWEGRVNAVNPTQK